jgi:hypothetical protein
MMYRFSRSIYRELAPHVLEDSATNGVPAKQEVLNACEKAMRRLAYDRRYFAHPAKTLFGDIRTHFPIHQQQHVYRVVERHVELAVEFLARLPEDIGLDGQPRHCRASTRKGKPCQREPLPGRDYCPSHKHLEESFEVEERQPVDRIGAAA